MNITQYLFLSDYGNCSENPIDQEIWFPEGHNREITEANVKTAKALCSDCLVKFECLKVALDNDEYGIWGGTTEQERQTMKLRSRRRMSAIA